MPGDIAEQNFELQGIYSLLTCIIKFVIFSSDTQEIQPFIGRGYCETCLVSIKHSWLMIISGSLE